MPSCFHWGFVSELVPILFVVIIVIGLVRSSRRRRRRHRPELSWTSPDSIGGLPFPESTGLPDTGGVPAETQQRRATTTEIADVLTSVLHSDQPLAATPAPTAPQPPSATPRPVPGPDQERAITGEGGTGPPDGPRAEDEDDVATPAPIFADIDPATMDPTVAAAMTDDNLLRAARTMRNASLNGIEGSDLALGMLYWKMGRIDEAEGKLRNIARTEGIAANNLAAILESRGYLREAMPFYRRAARAGNAEATANLVRLEG